MVRVVLSGNLKQFTGGEAVLELDVGTVHQLFRVLGERHPALKPHLEAGLAVAIDGQIYQDALLEPIPPGSEVHVVPPIAGGERGVESRDRYSHSIVAGGFDETS